MTTENAVAERRMLEAIEPCADIYWQHEIYDDSGPVGLLKCEKLLRCIPGKRLACVGEWNGRSIFAKYFLDSKRASIQANKEMRGIGNLTKSKILAPDLLISGQLKDRSIHVLLFEYLDECVSGEEVWRSSNYRQRLLLLRRLVEILAKQHAAGVVQGDLHLNNFLIGVNEIYSLDGADIIYGPKPLGLDQSIKNLALLFAQLPPVFDSWNKGLAQRYWKCRGWVDQSGSSQSLMRAVGVWRERRKSIMLKKILRQCSDFVCEKSWHQFVVFARQYDNSEFRKILADPDAFVDAGEILKPGNTSTVSKIVLGEQTLVIKRYNIKNSWHAIKRALRPSRAWVSWRNAHLLDFYGFNTPRPVAMIEQRRGLLRGKAYYLAEVCEAQDSLQYFNSISIDSTAKQLLALQIIRCLRRMQSLNIVHGDLKGSNILVGDKDISLIDLDAMKQYSFPYFANKSLKRDRRRFMRNWENSPEVQQLFAGISEHVD